MSIHRYQATWRSITFNTHLDNTGAVDNPASLVENNIASRYALDACEVNRVSVQDYRELRQFLEGGEPNEAFEGVRAINGSGRIVGSSPGDLEDKSWNLNEAFSVAACRLAAQALTPKGVLPFSFRRDIVGGNRQLRFYARPGPGRPVWVGRRTEGLIRPFSFQLIAFDPFAYEEAATNTNLANLAGGNNTVSNPGNIYTRPIIVVTFSGAGGASVTLANATTGKSLVLDLSAMANLQTLTIDPARGTIVRDNGSDQYSKRLSGFISDLFLNPGNNTITWSAATGVSQVQFQVRGAYA